MKFWEEVTKRNVWGMTKPPGVGACLSLDIVLEPKFPHLSSSRGLVMAELLRGLNQTILSKPSSVCPASGVFLLS